MILVTGATGNVGSELVKLLVGMGEQPRALVRDPDKSAPLQAAGVEVVQGDLGEPDTLDAALQGVDRAFLVTPAGPDQVELETSFIDAAKRAGGVGVVKLSLIDASADSPVAITRAHHEIEGVLKQSGLPWTILQPHYFMQNLLHSAQPIMAVGRFYGCLGDGRVGTVDVRDVAAVAAACLTEPGHDGKTYVLTGPESITAARMGEELAGVLGKEVRYVDLPAEKYRSNLLQFGVPESLASDLCTLYGSFAAGHGDVVTTSVQDVTGKPPRAFGEFARDYASSFAPR
jgi:uncharacterized protein YbjT (DUF2867 family)